MIGGNHAACQSEVYSSSIVVPHCSDVSGSSSFQQWTTQVAHLKLVLSFLKNVMTWRDSSIVEYLPSMFKALGPSGTQLKTNANPHLADQ